MVASESREVARVVQEQLRRSSIPTSRARVLADEVSHGSHDHSWWYVPVSLHRDEKNMALIYETFSVIEEKLEDEDRLRVLLVPRIIPVQRRAATA